MNNIYLIIAALCLAAAVAVIIRSHRKTNSVITNLERMLDDAVQGREIRETFRETRPSALETRLADYLSSTALTAENIALEKDKIKTLIADISHQTKTPIANLLLYSELLTEGELSPELRDNAEAIRSQTEKLRFLIDSLVKLSRLETGILTLSPRPMMLQPLLQSLRKQFIAKAESKDLTLTVKKSDACACFDPKWTEEALGNIVDNAIKYTDHGSVTISVTSYKMFVRIDITDSGIGIPEDERAKIFSRFYRSPNVCDSDGVGIGLYLAREIISEEGGYIKVSPADGQKDGQGSVFSVFLPRPQQQVS